jgi:hypothetical protein
MNTATVTVSQHIRRNHVAAIIERDGVRLGHVISRGTKFVAVRKNSGADDIRSHATGFQTVEAAAAFVAKAA